jgi:DNA/RNA-binding domain of Phe-tRNA-synthetase-like protein
MPWVGPVPETQQERVRGSNATINKRAPKVGCPENYYSKMGVSNLGSRRMVEALKKRIRKDLGVVA